MLGEDGEVAAGSGLRCHLSEEKKVCSLGVSDRFFKICTVQGPFRFWSGNSIPDQYCFVSGTQFGLLCSETQWFTTALESAVVSLRPETQGSLSLLLS
jgi:hypothetical protein